KQTGFHFQETRGLRSTKLQLRLLSTFLFRTSGENEVIQNYFGNEAFFSGLILITPVYQLTFDCDFSAFFNVFLYCCSLCTPCYEVVPLSFSDFLSLLVFISFCCGKR